MDSRTYKILRRREVCRKDSRCTLCPLHGGENYEVHGRKNRRFNGTQYVNRKPKEIK